MDKLNLPGSSPYFGVTTGFSRSFQSFIRDLGEAKSKYDEDKIIKRELARLRETTSLPSLSMREKKENMMRLVYGHILGHDVSFGYIYVIKLAEQPDLVLKRVGYLTLSLLLHENHEMTLLLMNTIRKDLLSKNLLIKSFGLSAAAKLVSKGMLPMVLETVLELVNHDREVIRKKAVGVMCKFYQLDPKNVQLDHILQGRLCDHDAGVLGTVLNGYLPLVKEDRLRYRSLIAPLVSIVKQILESRIPSDFNYYGVPAPWILIRGFQVLAELGADDRSASQEMFEMLGLCFDKICIDSNIGCAVTYECMKTITSIYPDPFLINMVTNRLSSFFMSKNNNMKYIGINMLARLISIDISYADGYQSTVIDSLNDSDETLKRKTLELLYQMTNTSNVDVVCSKLLCHLRSNVDTFFRTNLVTRITKLAERFAPDDVWYVKTINELLEVGGHLVNPEIAYNVMRLIGEGSDDEETSNKLIQSSLEYYMELVDKPFLPDILTQLVSWVVGEYACSSGLYSAEDVLQKLLALLRKKHSDTYTQSWILSAIIKVLGQTENIPHYVTDELRKCAGGMETDFMQRCSEALSISTVNADLSQIVPLDASCEDVEVESSLSFLDEISQLHVSQGAPTYNAEWRRNEVPERSVDETMKVNFTPYPLHMSKGVKMEEKKFPSQFMEPLPISEARHESTVQSNSKSQPKLWTPAGYVNKERLESVSTDGSDSISEAGSAKEETKDFSMTADEVGEIAVSSPDDHVDIEKQKLVQALFGGVAASPPTRDPHPQTKIHTRLGNDFAGDRDAKGITQLPLVTNMSKQNEEKSLGADGFTTGTDFVTVDDLLSLSESEDRSEGNTLSLSEQSIQGVSTNVDGDHAADVETISSRSSINLLDSSDASPVTSDVGLVSGSTESCTADIRRQYMVSDENIRISTLKEKKPNELILYIYITNHTPGTIHHCTLSIKAMSNLEFRLGQSETLTVSYEILSPRRTVQCALTLTYKAPAQNMTITGDLDYRDKAYNKKLLLLKFELSHLDFIRPLKTDAADFKDRWLTVGLLELSKTAVNTKGDMFLESLTTVGHLHIVDVEHKENEMEVLAAGSILGKTVVLLYFQVKSTDVRVLMRSNNSLLNQCIWSSLETSLLLNSDV